MIVLGASLNRTKASPQTVKNVEKFKDLNFKGTVILSGGFSYQGFTEAAIMYDLLDPKHKKSRYLLEEKSSSSNENVQFCLDIIQKHGGWKNIAVVDQPLHLFQLKLLFKHYLRLRHLDLNLKFIPARAVYGDNVKWWQYSHPLVYFIYLILCTCYYILKGKINLKDII
jgi:uncharacterized SAM-binding protein YcdF (DUF218 family)